MFLVDLVRNGRLSRAAVRGSFQFFSLIEGFGEACESIGMKVDEARRDWESPINADGRVTSEQFDALVADPVTYPPRSGSCGSCQSDTKAMAELTLDQMFQKARCTVCGCYLAEKVSWRSSECPPGKWNPNPEVSHVE